jgi:hypothetical protein
VPFPTNAAKNFDYTNLCTHESRDVQVIEARKFYNEIAEVEERISGLRERFFEIKTGYPCTTLIFRIC